MAYKQVLQIEISREDYLGKIRVPWLTSRIVDALADSSRVTRIEVKEVKKR